METPELSGNGLPSLSADFVEELFRQYSRDAESVPAEWQHYFAGLARGGNATVDARMARPAAGALTARGPAQGSVAPASAAGAPNLCVSPSQEKVSALVWAFRYWGHLAAAVDPLGLRGVGESFWASLHPTHQLGELTYEHHGLSEADLEESFSSPLVGASVETLREIIQRLRQIYCGSIGYEFMHVQDLRIRNWFLERIEPRVQPPTWDRARRYRMLRQLIRADAFEQFVRKKFPGAKVFSIDGSESLVPMLDLMLERAADQEIEDVVLGMAHRGRLNVLTNIFEKAPCDLFSSFEDRLPQGPKGHGDVRYHIGDDVAWLAESGRMLRLSLSFNPSHLEYVNAVAMGRVRAMQDQAGDVERTKAMTVLIHGDAAFAGEGIVYETLNLGLLSNYETGGVLHIIINNQIGFTTQPADARATTFATDVVRGVQVPVLHVNGEDLEAVARAVDLAMDFRRTFKRDIVIDLVGFRRWGHNETDEPSFTQPRLYSAIEKHGRLRERFAEQLIQSGEVTREEMEALDHQAVQYLRDEYDRSTRSETPKYSCVRDPDEELNDERGKFFGGPEPEDKLQTGVEESRLQELLIKLTETPQDFHVHPKLRRSQEDRRKMAAGEETIDWASAEALAIATLATEGHRIRLSGQDTQRGTFSHRHAILHDVVDGRTFNIFSALDPHQAPVQVINSPLSEAAAMGFEYGYSLEAPNALVAWEAQFGDFANVAQVIIDQFLASAEDKWEQLNGLVLLLPHGFEGQGPEHSSARLERFLTLAAEDNLQIVQPSTAAQYFHVLRRQVKRRWCKPLVVFTPKSLLRLRQARSPLSELTEGQFQRVIGDPRVAEASRVLLCSGKVYYELMAFREQQQREDVAIVRVEQYYPLPDRYLDEALRDCPTETPVYWVQEEPENMGAWRYWKARFGNRLLDRFAFDGITRAESASPATGSKAIHKQEQQDLMQRAMGEAAGQPALAMTSKEITA